jgi:hypothetical protein
MLSASATAVYSGAGTGVSDFGPTVMVLPGIGKIYAANCKRWVQVPESNDENLFEALVLRNESSETFFVGSRSLAAGQKDTITGILTWEGHEAPHYRPNALGPIRILAANGPRQALIYPTVRFGPNGCRWWISAFVSD